MMDYNVIGFAGSSNLPVAVCNVLSVRTSLYLSVYLSIYQKLSCLYENELFCKKSTWL